jgi:D-alanyl-D-alanine carboxypeptidase (penicillin-binding protein 5/6)
LPTSVKGKGRHWWGGRRHEHLHFETKQHSRRRARLKHVLIPIFVVVMVFAAASVKAAAAPEPDLSARRVGPPSVRLAGQAPEPAWPATGQASIEVEGLPPLGTSGGTKPVPIASLAKVMTAYVLLQDHPLTAGHNGYSVTVTPADVADYESRLATAQSVVEVQSGEVLTELQLLQGLLVPSANNFAAIIATHEAGSIAAFVSEMNAAAAKLGMTHTTYTDPAGLDPTTVSTAGDQMTLAAHVMANPLFAQIVASPYVVLPVVGVVDNFNTAVGHNGYIGIKTGSDSTAGGCLMFANTQVLDGHPTTVLGVVLGQDTGTQNTAALIGAAVNASTTLVRSVVPSVALRTVLPKGAVVGSVTNPQGRRVPLTTTSSLNEMGYGGEIVPLTLTLHPVGSKLTAGATVGRVSAGNGGPSAAVTAGSTMPPVSFTWKLLHDY